MSNDTRQALAALVDVCDVNKHVPYRVYHAALENARSALAAQPVAPKGFALVPLRMNAEIQRVVDQDNWLWEDLLAAAESITLEQYDEIAAQPVAELSRWEWLASHCHALGMTKKSDSGLIEHDIALFVADLKAKAQPVAGAVATDETGWLIEHSGEILPGAEQRAQVSWLRVQMKFNGYGAREFGFTHDANEALRFARKEDAEAVLAMHLGASPPDWYSKPFSVTEHMWPAASQAQAAPAPEPSAKGEPVTDAAILEAATKMFPMWREDIQPRFVVEVGRAALALASAPSTQPPAVVEAVPLTDEQIDNLRGLDTAGRVRFYEHDFYVLSNFSAFTLQWKGRRFDTSEAAYHWEKFADRDDEVQDMILEAPSAHEAFKIAESQRAMRRADWDAVKVGIMLDILRAKADQHEYVRRKLLATGDRELVEDSWRDDFWGWGPNRDGKNMLGRLWMQVRSELRGIAPKAAQP